jgi:hypothetical protein
MRSSGFAAYLLLLPHWWGRCRINPTVGGLSTVVRPPTVTTIKDRRASSPSKLREEEEEEKKKKGLRQIVTSILKGISLW